MASPLLPALAAGALLALLSQIPPSLNAAQRLLPVEWRPDGQRSLGSLSHRAPRHAAPRVLPQNSASERGPGARGGASGVAIGVATTASAPTTPERWRSGGPRRPWGFTAPAFSGAAQAGGLPPPAHGSPAAHR